jgi:hypothetical protein
MSASHSKQTGLDRSFPSRGNDSSLGQVKKTGDIFKKHHRVKKAQGNQRNYPELKNEYVQARK